MSSKFTKAIDKRIGRKARMLDTSCSTTHVNMERGMLNDDNDDNDEDGDDGGEEKEECYLSMPLSFSSLTLTFAQEKPRCHCHS